MQFERSSLPKERDFLLFSDCLVWLANLDRNDHELAERWDWLGGGGAASAGKGLPNGRPEMSRSRSRSEAELGSLRDRVRNSYARSPSRQGHAVASPSKMKKRQASSGTSDERWWYKGRAELVDLDIVVNPPTELGENTRFELLSPEMSFAVYACEWFALAPPWTGID